MPNFSHVIQKKKIKSLSSGPTNTKRYLVSKTCITTPDSFYNYDLKECTVHMYYRRKEQNIIKTNNRIRL